MKRLEGRRYIAANAKHKDGPTQQIYLNTRTGALSYVSPGKSFAPGASVVNFLHLGQGTAITTPLGGGFAGAGPGLFPFFSFHPS